MNQAAVGWWQRPDTCSANLKGSRHGFTGESSRYGASPSLAAFEGSRAAFYALVAFTFLVGDRVGLLESDWFRKSNPLDLRFKRLAVDYTRILDEIRHRP